MKNITELNGHEFSKFMERLKEVEPTVYKDIYDYYFLESGSIEESWDDDPDDVWDAEGNIEDICESNKVFKNIVRQILKEI